MPRKVMMRVEKGRVGQFFLFVGVILLIIFFSIDPDASPLVSFFFWGIGFTGLGLYLIRRDWKKPPPSKRFRLFRKPQRRPEDDSYSETRKDV